MGRCVYGGLFDPGHPSTTLDGFRTDVQSLVRELGVGVVRYPGGNFVSGYRWEDGVGPVDARSSRLDLAWRSLEPNTFGLDEFLKWADQVDAEPMLAVNLGTRGLDDAVNLLEYTNFPSGSRYAELRIANGRREPYGVKLWCLGNEMDGPWQIGHKTADQYGRLAAETAKAMKLVDPSVELIACGSSHERMPTFGLWEAQVLEHTYNYVDYVSLHGYYAQTGQDRVGYLASADTMDAFINGVVATCDHVAARKHYTRRMQLSFDEWNLEPRSDQHWTPWVVGPRISEEVYTIEDAVVVGGLLISLLRHSDRVAIACLAQLVNVMAPIRTEQDRAWRQAIFHPFALTSHHARGEVLRVETRSPDTVWSTTRGEVKPVDAVATRDPESGTITIFATNRSTTRSAILLAHTTAGAYRVTDHLVIAGSGPDDACTPATSKEFRPTPSSDHQTDDNQTEILIPPASWTMVCISPTKEVSNT